MISSTFIASATVKHNDYTENTAARDNDVKKIRVTILTDEKESDEDFYGPYGRTRYFMWALSNYSWMVGNTSYYFNVTLLPIKKLLRGELTTDNYDVLIYPPDTANEKLFRTGFSRLPRNILLKKRITNFVQDGGGYFATCGAAAISGELENKPKTFMERLLKNSCLGISGVKISMNTAIPILSQWAGFGPQAVGSLGYLMYGAWNQTNPNDNYHSGACIDVSISKSNPIFNDYLEDTRRIRWIGLPALVISEDSDREITVLASFPAEKISDNDTIQISHWKYTGGLRGLVKALFKQEGDIHYWDNLGIFMKTYVLASDWEPDMPVETNFSNEPFMTAEIYPNENKARIVLCAGHPEDNVWWGGYIEEVEDTKDNNLYEGFYHWKDIIPEENTTEDEFSYNYWIVRRSVAWVSKIVPDNDLPPIYDPLEVIDI